MAAEIQKSRLKMNSQNGGKKSVPRKGPAVTLDQLVQLNASVLASQIQQESIVDFVFIIQFSDCRKWNHILNPLELKPHPKHLVQVSLKQHLDFFFLAVVRVCHVDKFNCDSGARLELLLKPTAPRTCLIKSLGPLVPKW